MQKKTKRFLGLTLMTALTVSLADANAHADLLARLKQLFTQCRSSLCGSLSDDYSSEGIFGQLRDLQIQGTQLNLIVGRGNLETSLPLQDGEQARWVYADKNPKVLSDENDGLVLVVDFNDEEALKKIPSDLFSRIIIDSSTWKFLNNTETNIPQYARILAPGGKLYFEAYRGDHIVDKNIDKIQYSPEAAPNSFSFPAKQRALLSLKEVLDIVLPEIEQRYQVFFLKNGFSQVVLHRNEEFPVRTTYPVKDFFEATK